VLTARYALSPYIKQIRFVFKGLIVSVSYKSMWQAVRVTCAVKILLTLKHVATAVLILIGRAVPLRVSTYRLSTKLAQRVCRYPCTSELFRLRFRHASLVSHWQIPNALPGYQIASFSRWFVAPASQTVLHC
jgi:hypothetical protein